MVLAKSDPGTRRTFGTGVIADVFVGEFESRVEFALVTSARVAEPDAADIVDALDRNTHVCGVDRDVGNATMEIEKQPPITPLRRTAPSIIGFPAVMTPGRSPGLGIRRRLSGTTIVHETQVLLLGKLSPRLGFAGRVEPA